MTAQEIVGAECSEVTAKTVGVERPCESQNRLCTSQNRSGVASKVREEGKWVYRSFSRIVYTLLGEESKQTNTETNDNEKVITKEETENEDDESGFSLFKKKRSFSSTPKTESLPVASRETQCPIDSST